MKLKRKIASLLAFIMSFSTIAAFSVSADTIEPAYVPIMPLAGTISGPATLSLTEGEPMAPVTLTSAGWTAGYSLADTAAASRWTATGLPAGITLEAATGILSGTPTAAQVATNATITATATNLTGPTTEVATYTISFTVNAPTVFPGFSAQTRNLTVGTPSATTLSAAESGVTFALATGATMPAGLTLESTGAITGTPAANTVGTHIVSVVATNPVGGLTQTADVTLIIGAAIPVFSVTGLPTTNQVWQVGQAITNIAPGHTNAPSGTTGVTWGATGLPAGVTIDAATGVISGTPTAEVAINTTVTVTATAAPSTDDATGTFTFMVQPAAWVPPAGGMGRLRLTDQGTGQITNQVSLNTNYRLVDRYVAATGSWTEVATATTAWNENRVRPFRHAPELIMPAAHREDMTITLAGWGNGVWAHMNPVVAQPANTDHPIQGGNMSMTQANWDNIVRTFGNVAPLGTSMDSTRPANNGRWYVLGNGQMGWSGIANTGSEFRGEVSYILRFSNTVITLELRNLPGESDGVSVIRVPLAANVDWVAGNNTWNRTAPTVTLNSQGIVDRPLTFISGVGATNLIGGTVVTGRDSVTLNNFTVRGPIDSWIADGEIAFRLPFDYRFGPVSDVTVTFGGQTLASNLIAIPQNSFFVSGSDAGNPNFVNPRDGISSQAILVVTLPSTIPAGLGQPTLDLVVSGLRVISNELQGNTRATGNVALEMITGGGNTNTQGMVSGISAVNVGRELRPAFRNAGTSSVNVATFAEHGVTFNRVGGANAAQGYVPTIVGGWLPAVGNQAGRAHPYTHERGVGRNQLTGAAAYGNVASVQLTEVVPESILRHGATFTLVDADGNLHPYASIRSVNLISSTIGGGGQTRGINGNFTNQRTAANAHLGVTTTATGNAIGANGDVSFNENGRSVTVRGIDAARDSRIQITAHFAITADVNFEGNIYISVNEGGVTGTNVGAFIDVPPVEVANVRRAIFVETESTVIPVGMQQISVADITIREAQPGDFRQNSNIRVYLGEYGIGQLTGNANPVFTPITAANVANHITVGGATSQANRVGASLQPIHGTDNAIHINIGRQTQGTEPSYIQLTGLSVRTDRGVPHGTFELIVRGSSVLNNEAYRDLNMNGNTPIRFNEANRARFAHHPLYFLGYVDTNEAAVVGQGGAGAGAFNPANMPSIAVPHQAGTTFYIDGEARTFADGIASISLGTPAVVGGVTVPAGRLFVPFREIVEALAGYDGTGANPIQFHAGNTFQGIPHVIIVTIGDRTVTFTTGDDHFVRDGVRVPMNYAGTSFAPFIGDGTTGVMGRTYLPLRFIANAFGLELQDNVNGNAVIN